MRCDATTRVAADAEVDPATCILARSRVAEEVHTGASPAAKVAMSR
jgi:hypothetical protein